MSQDFYARTFFSILFLTSGFAQAGEALPEAIVITATRTPTPAERIGSSISLITEQDLKKRQTRQVVDVLREVPGLNVTQAGSFGGTTAVRLRGTESHNTVVLIDGVEVSDPSRPQVEFEFAHLLAGGIERIEVLRGSQSTLYGSDAVGGVINIITKTGRGTPRHDVTLEGGSFATNRQAYSTSGGIGDLGFSFHAERFDTDGISAADESDGNTEEDGAENVTLLGKLVYDLTDSIRLQLNGRSVEADTEFDDFRSGVGPVDGDADSEVVQRSARAAAEVSLLDGRWFSELALGYSLNRRDGFEDGEPAFFNDGERLKLEYQGTLNFGENQVLVLGAETEEETIETGSVAGREVRINGFYAQYQFDLFDRLFLSLGARLDDHETFGSEDTYRFAGAYPIAATGTRFKASYGTGFRAPSLFELFSNFGNPDLGPERSRSFDAGIEQTLLNGRLRLGATWFDVEIEDRIAFALDFDDAGSFAGMFRQTSGRSESHGIEVEAAFEPVSYLGLSAAYTYNETEDSETGEPFERRPKHVAHLNANLGFGQGKGNLNLHLRYVDGAVDDGLDLDDYFLANLAASYEPGPRWRLFGRVDNLFDAEYQEALGFGTPDRSFIVGGTVRF